MLILNVNDKKILMSLHIQEVSSIFIRSIVSSFKWSFWKWFFSSFSTTAAVFCSQKIL